MSPATPPPSGGTIDTLGARRRRNWTGRELVARVAWGLVQPLFRFSPRLLWGWRRTLLRLFGARIGRHVNIHPTVQIFAPWNLVADDFASIGDSARVYNLATITLGRSASVSQGAHLCGGSHDYSQPDLPVVKAPITIEAGAWVAADGFVGPDVTVGHDSIVAARAVVLQDVPPWVIVGGNPARVIAKREAPRPGAD